MTGSEAPGVGALAPRFTAPLVSPDGSVEETPLESLLDGRALVLSFFPSDFNPESATQWCSIRDYEWFGAADRVRIVGVSASSPEAHRRFINRFGLDFPLYSSPDLSVPATYGVRYRFLGLLSAIRRARFLLDADGVIRYRWLADDTVDPAFVTPPVESLHEAILRRIGVDGRSVGRRGAGAEERPPVGGDATPSSGNGR